MLPVLYHYASLIRRDRQGVTALEYGLIAALIGVFIITALGLLGNQLVATFASIAASMKAA
jgi:pilus assembly protein Flp/PilA